MPEGRIHIRLRALVAVVVVTGLCGFGAAGLVRQPADPEQPTVRVPPADDGPTRRSARAFAVDLVRHGQTILDQTPTERAATLRSLAADEVADEFVAQQSGVFDELDAIARRGTGALTWHVSVLATRVEAFTRNRARVALWRVGILSIEGLVAPLAEWATITYELVWQHQGWRVWSEDHREGPTPMGHPEETPSTPRELADVLRGFHRFNTGEPI